MGSETKNMLPCAKGTCLRGLDNMPRRCTICHHPHHEEIAVSLFRNGTRATARRFQVSRPALDRHKGHLPGTIVKAQQAELVCEATSLLTRVESLMQESENIAAAAKLEKNWPAATSALREARGCLELLGKLRGELQQPGALHLHKHAHAHIASQPRNEVEIDVEIARHVAAATGDFSAEEIARLKGLLERDGPQSNA
jgi:hypothetical protein